MPALNQRSKKKTTFTIPQSTATNVRVSYTFLQELGAEFRIRSNAESRLRLGIDRSISRGWMIMTETGRLLAMGLGPYRCATR